MSAPAVIVRKFVCVGERLFDNAFEADLGRRIGLERFTICRRLKLKPYVVQDLDAVRSNDQFGGMAEVAVARWLNVWPTTEFTQFLFYNLTLPGGDRVAVQYNDKRKAAVLDQWREALRIKKRREAPDLYIVLTDVLFLSSGRVSFAFAGWTTHAELVAAPVETLKTYGPRWVQDTLHDRLDLLTCARGHGYRPGPETGRFDFETPGEVVVEA